MPLNPWRLRLLSQLETLGTVRAVAKAAMMSPSSVSQQLAVLEAETGTKLLERVGRRVELTPAGLVLAARATAILDQMDAAQAELDGLTTSPAGLVRLSSFPSAMRSVVLPAAREINRTYPLIRLQVSELEPGPAASALRRGEIDLAVTFDFGDGSMSVDPTVRHSSLGSDAVVLVVPELAGAPGHGPVDLGEYATAEWSLDLPGSYLSNLTLRLCREAGFEPVVSGRFSSFDVQLDHVGAGLSVALLPELAVDDRFLVRTAPLPAAPRRRITAACRAVVADRVAIAVTLDALRRSASAVLGAERGT